MLLPRHNLTSPGTNVPDQSSQGEPNNADASDSSRRRCDFALVEWAHKV
jgi:hypothetical protein